MPITLNLHRDHQGNRFAARANHYPGDETQSEFYTLKIESGDNEISVFLRPASSGDDAKFLRELIQTAEIILAYDERKEHE